MSLHESIFWIAVESSTLRSIVKNARSGITSPPMLLGPRRSAGKEEDVIRGGSSGMLLLPGVGVADVLEKSARSLIMAALYDSGLSSVIKCWSTSSSRFSNSSMRWETEPPGEEEEK